MANNTITCPKCGTMRIKAIFPALKEGRRSVHCHHVPYCGSNGIDRRAETYVVIVTSNSDMETTKRIYAPHDSK